LVLRSGAEWALPCPRPAGYTRPDLEPLSFDDLPLGGEWTTRRRTISESDIALFSGVVGDLSPLTIEAADGQARSAPPALVLAMAVGLGSVDMPIPAIAEWEWLNWKFPRKVHAGDTIFARWTLTQKRPPAVGAPSSIVVWRVDVHTADGALCAEGEVGAKVKRREAAAARQRSPEPAAGPTASAASAASAASPASAAPRRRRRRRAPNGTAPEPQAAAAPPAAAAAKPAEKAARASPASRRRRRRRPAGASGQRENGGGAAAPGAPAPAPPTAAPAANPGAPPAKGAISRVIGRLRRT